MGFEQKNRLGSQEVNNDIFCRPPVTSTHCIIRTKKNPDSGRNRNYADDDFSQGYGKTDEAFKCLKKYDFLQH